ncbi:MAG: zf-HC2 domain-containing protein [Brevibacillus sp.]|nr:zf-HC2 domain-containing protein [Brevibacillus sp.]
MSHIDDLTMMMYTDGELSDQESKEVEAHLQQCQKCRQSCELWMEDRVFFKQSFHHSSASPPSLYPSVLEQIHTIGMLHRIRLKYPAALVKSALILLPLLLLGSMWIGSWLSLWIDILWPIIRPYLLWFPPFWLLDNAVVLWENALVVGYLFSILSLALIAAVIVTSANRQSAHWEIASEGRK